MADIAYPLFPILSFLGFILSLIPLPWHLQAWNSGTCYYMMWSSLLCLNQFINAIVWSNNAIDFSPAWCEISIRIIMGASVGLPLASLCINRRLYLIANAQHTSTSLADKTRAVIIDSLICVLAPMVYLALQYIVQGHRYNIFEDVGCYPALYNTLPTFFISSMWPIVIGLISGTYCFLSLQAFLKRRLEFSQFINSNTSSLTMGRYFRLMALATIEIVFTTPLAIFTIWLNATASPVNPWRGWADTHFDFSRIEQIPAIIWRQNHLLSLGLEFSRWISILCAVIFFAFFGFADEAKRNYRKVISSLAKVLRINLKKSSPKASHDLPSIGHFNKIASPRSLNSFTSTTTSLPLYSPPPSSSLYPMTDLKTSFPGTSELKATPSETDVETDRASLSSTYSLFPIRGTPRTGTTDSKHFSWKTLLQSSSSRRHSSYV